MPTRLKPRSLPSRETLTLSRMTMWNWGDLGKETDLPAEIRQVLDQIVEKKIGYQPTIEVLQGLRAYFDPEYLKTEAITKVIPREMLEWFNSPEGKWFKKELAQDDMSDAAMSEAYEKGPVRRVRQVVAYLAKKNANFLFDTDTPSAPTYGNLPGLNGYLEMQQLQKAGLSLAQIFKAATINNAPEFKLDSQIGTIEPGKFANLVLLNKSPLESLDAYDSIATVWVHGEPGSRDSLAVNSKNPALPRNASEQALPVRAPELSGSEESTNGCARSIEYVAARRASRTARSKQIALLAVSTRRILARKFASLRMKMKLLQMCALPLLLLCSAEQPLGQSFSEIGLQSPDKLELHNVKADSVTFLGPDVVRITDAGAANLDDASRLAIVRGTDFQDGVIEVNLSGDTAPDARPEFRGFARISFRVSTDRSRFECLYLRPKNGRSEDQLQRNHSV
jgi:hypothetical protein